MRKIEQKWVSLYEWAYFLVIRLVLSNRATSIVCRYVFFNKTVVLTMAGAYKPDHGKVSTIQA